MLQINPNGKGLVGFNGQVDTTSIINKLVEVEQKKTEPVVTNIEKRQTEADAWSQIKTLMEDLRTKAETLSSYRLWDKKLAESSDPKVLTASAGKDAKPGTTNLVVDKIALNHQIASNIIPAKDVTIGAGIIRVQLGYKEPVELKIEQNSTAEDVVKKINESDLGVEAAIVQVDDTGEKFQMVLTSKTKGWKGRMTVNFDLINGKHLIDFNSSYTQPEGWIYKNRAIPEQQEISENDSSTSLPQFSGLYRGTEDLEITFTALTSGTVGAKNQLAVKWEDNLGRTGTLSLDALNYQPEQDIEVTDGIFVRFNKGTIVQNDQFRVKAKPDETGLWYVPDEEEPAKIYKPTPWYQKNEGMAPITVTGDYTGDDDTYYFRVKEAGVVGKSERVIVEYTSDEGKKGELLVGMGYEPGKPLDLGDGLQVSFPAGILIKDAVTEFEAEEKTSGIFWWLNNGDDVEANISEPLDWRYPEGLDGELELNAEALRDRTGDRSNILPRITGVYTGDKNKQYTMTVEGNGTVGVPDFLNLVWDDGEGNTGRIKINNTYSPGSEIEFFDGLKIIIPKGELQDGDYLSFSAFTNAIQPAQDAVIRLNATSEGGGLIMRSSDNTFTDAIEGVTLTALKSSPEVITVTVTNDTESPKTAIKEYVESYNAILKQLKESSKYDPQTKIAGPLQADGNVVLIRDSLSRQMINVVRGLPREANMSTYAGVSFNKTGTLDFDEEKFNSKISEDIEKVAKIFATAGESSIKGIEFLDITDKTKISGGEREIRIDQVATKGSYTSALLGDYIWINEDNDTYRFEINGRSTNDIQLTNGVYNRKEFLKMMQKTLTENEDLANTRFTVDLTESGDRLFIESDSYGSSSAVNVTTPLDINDYNEDFALVAGKSVQGRDTQGSLGGETLEGLGKVLKGTKDTALEGLRLFVDIPDDQYRMDADGTIEPLIGTFNLTKGISTRTKEYAANELQTNIGINKRITDVNERITDQKKRLDRINEGIERKKADLIKRFGVMEGAVASLKEQQSSTMALLSQISN